MPHKNLRVSQNCPHALSDLRDAVRRGHLIIRKHAREQMAVRDRTRPEGMKTADIEEAILTATFAKYQPGRKTYFITGGRDLAEQPLNLVCALDPERVVRVGLNKAQEQENTISYEG
jgi:hypothetical protein